jgi:hypothetical protein
MEEIEIQNDVAVVDNTDTAASVEGDAAANETPTPTQPSAPSIDFAALYRESLAERRRMEEEIASIRNQQNAPKEEPLTDADIERYGTVGTIERVIENKLRQHLSEQFGPITELSKEFKRNKQIESAEAQFFQQFPQLEAVRGNLTQIVRQAVSNVPNVDGNTYGQAALAAIGLYNINQMTQQQQNAPVQNNTPSRTSAPAPRVNGAPTPSTPTRRLSELERTAMKQAGFDPNKRDDIDKFFAIVENDEGITL